MGLVYKSDKPFSVYVKENREKKNLSVRQLSKLSGLSQSTILNYEKGVSQPNLLSALNLAYALEVPLKELIFHLDESLEDTGILCYDLDTKYKENSQFIFHTDNLNNDEKLNKFLILKDKKILLFSETEEDSSSGYLIKNTQTGELKITSEKEENSKIIGYFIREINT